MNLHLLVETADLRSALTATHPFTEKDLPSFSCVTITPGPHVTEVTASNGSAAALAIVSTLTLDADDGEVAPFDLSVPDVKKILQVFQGKPGKDGEPGAELRLDVDPDHVTLTDASGFFEGPQLVLPRQPDREHRPNVTRSLGHFVHQPPSGPPGGESLLFGPNLARMVGACKVYGVDLVLEFHPTREDRHTVIIRCGESFLGIVSPRWIDDDEKARLAEHRKAWNRRIPDQVDDSAWEAIVARADEADEDDD